MPVTEIFAKRRAKYGAQSHDFRFDAYDGHLSDEMARRDNCYSRVRNQQPKKCTVAVGSVREKNHQQLQENHRK